MTPQVNPNTALEEFWTLQAQKQTFRSECHEGSNSPNHITNLKLNALQFLTQPSTSVEREVPEESEKDQLRQVIIN